MLTIFDAVHIYLYLCWALKYMHFLKTRAVSKNFDKNIFSLSKIHMCVLFMLHQKIVSCDQNNQVLLNPVLQELIIKTGNFSPNRERFIRSRMVQNRVLSRLDLEFMFYTKQYHMFSQECIRAPMLSWMMIRGSHHCHYQPIFTYHICHMNSNCTCSPFKHQPHKMVKDTKIICQKQLINYLSLFDHFVGLALNGLRIMQSLSTTIIFFLSN